MQDYVPVTCFEAAAEWPPDTYLVPQYFLACEVTGVKLAVSAEHTEIAWRPYEQAYDQLRYESNKTALWELAQRLRTRDFQPG